MPVVSQPELRPVPQLDPWVPPPETKASLDCAPLLSLDLSIFDSPGGKESLTNDLKRAVTTWGFWTVTGTGIPQEQIDRMFSIADAFFKLSLKEKKKVSVDYSIDRHYGYREAHDMVKDGRTMKQNLEIVNIQKLSCVANSGIPIHDLTEAFRGEIAEFQKLCYDRILKKILILFAVILEVPEDYFLQRHGFEDASEDHVRMLKYHARPKEADEIVNGQWLAGHTDFGSVSLLFPQTVSALQVKSPSGEWKWVKPVPGGITCNSADVMSFLTKGYFKSAIHRVIRPPDDQAQFDRISIVYFLRPSNGVPVVPVPSPLLHREGIISDVEMDGQVQGEIVTCEEYVRARVKYVNHDRKLWRADEGTPDKLFEVKGLSVQDYYL